MAQDVVYFASVSDKKFFDKVIVKVSLQCCCVDIMTVQPCHCYCYDRVVM